MLDTGCRLERLNRDEPEQNLELTQQQNFDNLSLEEMAECLEIRPLKIRQSTGRNVLVRKGPCIRLIAEDSLECEVVALAKKKRIAAQSVLHEGFKTAASLTCDEIRGLLLREIDRVKPLQKAEDEGIE